MLDFVKFILLKIVDVTLMLIIANGPLLLFIPEIYSTNFGISLLLINTVVLLDKLFQPLIIQKKEKNVSTSYNTVFVILLVLAFPLLYALPYLEYYIIESVIPPEVIFVCWVLGALMIIIGGTIVVVSRVTLGKQSSVAIGIEKEHKLVTTGPYHIIRHPIYTGAILYMLGYTLSFCSFIVSIILFLILAKTLTTRMTVEETLLTQTFGDDYRNYMKRTKRLIPHIY